MKVALLGFLVFLSLCGTAYPWRLKLTDRLGGAQSIPKSVDWRKEGVVPAVRNQGQCGSSDIFAAVGAIDSFHAIQTGKLVLASVEEVVDCCNGGSCEGGLVGDVYACVVQIGGLATEEEYSSPDSKCLNDTFKPAVKIQGGKTVQTGNETALAVAVSQQPVAVVIDASHESFQLYSGGIYDEPNCSSTMLDHAMLVVGYGSEEGQEYWIVQNSWGVSWGMQGYILMSRNKDNQCGIATDATYPF